MRKFLKEMATVFTIAGGMDLMYNRAFKSDSNVLQNEWRKAKEEAASQTEKINQLQEITQSDKLELTGTNESLKDNLKTLYDNVGNLRTECLKNSASESCKHYLQNFKQAYDEAVKRSDKITEIIDKKFMDNWYNDYQDFVSNLTDEQYLALIHVLILIGISIIIYNIIITYYSDRIIKYFKIEAKYPKLARFIELRRKFQFYYLTLNLIILSSITLIVLIFNFCILFKIF